MPPRLPFQFVWDKSGHRPRLLHGEADIARITTRVSEMSGKQVLPGSAVLALSRLEKRGLIHSWKRNRKTESRGDAAQYFTVTLGGENALAYAKETSRVVADLLGDFA